MELKLDGVWFEFWVWRRARSVGKAGDLPRPVIIAVSERRGRDQPCFEETCLYDSTVFSIQYSTVQLSWIVLVVACLQYSTYCT